MRRKSVQPASSASPGPDSYGRGRVQGHTRRRRRTWVVEGLEDRVLLSGNPTYYTVNLMSDTGTSSGTDANTGDPSGDLLWAILQANVNTNPAGSAINFDPTVFATPQTITLSSTLELSESAGPEAIQGPGAGLVTVSGGNAVEVFQVDTGVSATLTGLTIADGSAGEGGGVANEGGTLTITDCTLAHNSANDLGGGIFNNGTTAVTDSTLENNVAGPVGDGGGGIFNGGALSIIDSTLADNSGHVGGGVAVYGTTTITGSTFVGNMATDSGGEGGGAIWNSGTLTVADTTIEGNSTVPGDPAGGGITNDYLATVTDCTINDNTASFGGGIANTGGTLTVINSTIAGNTAINNGGGVLNYYGTLTAINTTIADNDGGYNYLDGGSNGGGGVYTYNGTTTLDNTIVAANTADDGADDVAGAGLSSASSYNLVGVDETGSLTSGTDGNIVIGPANPGLGLLASNGGPTQTIALLAGSPAIDAGSNALAVDPTTQQPLSYDQRGPGFSRIVNGTVDIGAYERAVPTLTTLVSSPNPSSYGQTITLTATVTASGAPTVYTVNSTGSANSGTGISGTLPYVLGQADLNPNLAGSVIQFDTTVFSASNPLTITLTSTLELGDPSGPLVIDGPGGGAVTISGGGAVAVFQGEPGAVTTLSGLTVSGGSATYGGGILVEYDSTLTVAGCAIVNNTSDYGGGVFNNGGSLTVSDTMISGNSAFQGGGGIFSYGTVTVTGGSTIEDNSTGGNGGGVDNDNNATLTVNDGSAIEGNTALDGGGIGNFGSLTVRDSTIAGNSAGGAGGGAYNWGTLTISNSTIQGNSAAGFHAVGGGLVNAASATLTDCTIAGNSASYNGGGLLNEFNYGTALLTVVDSTIEDNSVGIGQGFSTGGGGIFVGGDSVSIVGSTIAANSTGAYGPGAGINNPYGGTVAISDSTITGNSAGGTGGGIANANGGTLTAINVTIAYNTANADGGLFDGPQVVASLYNTIIAVNTGDRGGGDVDGAAVNPASSNDLIGVDDTGSLTNGTDGNLVIGAANPGLGLLTNNGGTTQTIALLAGSPAIDAGSNALAVDPTTGQPLPYDQRGPGYPRIVNGTVDIGAFEVQIAPATTTTTTLSSLANLSDHGQSVSFTATVAPTTGSGTPTGTVQFLIDGSDFGGPVSLVDGSATTRPSARFRLRATPSRPSTAATPTSSPAPER